MLTVFGFLLMFYVAASGLQSEDPVVCRFTENDTCYVARGQQVHLPIPPVEGFSLLIGNRAILRFRKNTNTPTPNPSRWLFVKENNTMILTSAEWSDSGTYTLETFDAGGTSKGKYTLQIYMKDLTLVILSSVCASLIVLAVLAFFVYKKRHRLRNKQEPSQNGKDSYTQVLRLTPKRTVTNPSAAQAPNEDVKNTYPSQRNQEKREEEVPYTELMFNTPSQEKNEISNEQDKCVYSQIQYGP
ncbi:uncharacterized protein LOC124396323 [Silurus meridionalis]|uniref:Uncharacterized protein n=1 Tax=Silurus meridionalis TaxID=175797 RepID=A0A8T0AZG9_SILME|nr:uncharacterized protein LOC124396323 [Silurus meridionalis]KAF7698366.1 hypothetical protein HF521_004876 [Silurus meridionalis]